MIKLKSHKLFHVNGSDYLFVAETGAIYEIDEQIMAVVEQDGYDKEQIASVMLQKFGTTEKELNGIFNEFRNIGLLENGSLGYELLYSDDYLHGIELMVCQCCNLACKYCYALEGEYQNPGWMSTDTGKKAIDFLFEHAKSNSVSISFFGGEPLLNMLLIAELVEYAETLALIHDKTVSFAVTTNGTLINEEVAEFLRNHRFYISLSIDGTKMEHDICRVDKHGCGSYENSIKSIELLEDSQITLRATSTPQNCNYVEISDALFQLRKTDFFIGEAMNCFCTDEDLGKVEKAYNDLITYFFKSLQAGEIAKCRCNLLIYQNLKKIAHFKKRCCSCSSLIGTIAVDIQGNIYPCHRFVGSSHYLGNLLSGKFDAEAADIEFTQNFLLQNRVGCSECWAQNLCAGGCAYLNWETNKCCYIPDPMKCRLNRYLYQKLIILFLALTNEQKKALEL